MRRWIRKAAALLGAGILLADLCAAEIRAEEKNETYQVTFRIHGDGAVKLENASYGETVLESGEKKLDLTPGTFVKVTAQTSDKAKDREEAEEGQEDNSVISITVTTSEELNWNRQR